MRAGPSVRIDSAALRRRLRGRRVGLVCTPAAWRPGRGPLSDFIAETATLRACLALEHGFRGELQDGVRVDSYTDARTGVPVYSFYGAGRDVPPAFFADVDLVLFCAQDVSHRAYTFHGALADVLRAAARRRCPVLVVDRPSPLAHLGPAGPVATQFFPLPMPVLPALTLGELARWCNEAGALGAELEVLPVRGWERRLGWPLAPGWPWLPPSPNIPTLDSAYAYACTGILQATSVAEGRGTCKPFEYIGAPFVDGARLAAALNRQRLPGVQVREVYFQPGFNKFAGRVCGGVHLLITDHARLRPLAVQLALLQQLARLFPGDFTLASGFGAWLDGAGDWMPAALAELDCARCLERAARAARTWWRRTAAARLYPD
jgi:uncharacterized protein YbbC (DUF1343 family)